MSLLSRLKKQSWPQRIAGVFIFICFVAGCYGTFIEPFRLVTTRWIIQTPKWTAPHELKIAVLTDLHMKWPWMTPGHLQDIVAVVNKLEPDIVVLLGDYVATHPFGIVVPAREGLAALEKLSPRCGVYAVLGNHDLNPLSDWEPAFKTSTIRLLQNDAVAVKCGDSRFWISGLEELWWGNPSIEKTLLHVEDDSPVIMLMHNPDSFAEMPDRVALSLAGHTHGGQIRFPLIGAVESVIPSKFGKRFLYGHIHEDGKDLVVSSGLGMTGIPMRLLTPPEVTFITLKGR